MSLEIDDLKENLKMSSFVIAIVALLTSALIVGLHHYKIHRYWFDKSDLDCHEVWFVSLITMAGGVYIGHWIGVRYG